MKLSINKNKAFTLVELLGVITLLGVIALIITPNILNIQKKSDKEVFENNINLLLRSAQIYYADNDFYNFPSEGLPSNSSELNIKDNESFTGGVIRLIDNDYFFADNITDGKYCASGSRNDLTITNGACKKTPDNCFEFNSDSGTITRYKSELDECKISNVTVPDNIIGIPVKNIGTAAFANYEYFNCDNNNEVNLSLSEVAGSNTCIASTGTKNKSEYPNIITSIFLPTSIENIENYAFANNDIKTINLSNINNLKKIGSGAFSNNSIKNIDLQLNKNLKSIGYGAFANNQIDSITFTGATSLESIDAFSFNNNPTKELKISNLPLLKKIGNNAFYENEITDLYLNNLPKLISIGDNAFYENNFDNLVLNNLPLFKTIGNNAFSYCKATNIELNKLNSLTEIPSQTFMHNTTDKIVMKDLNNLVTINSNAFYDSFSDNPNPLDLSGLINLKTINENAFYYNNFNSITIPLNVTTIGNNAFTSKNNTITSVTVKGSNPTRFNSNWTNIGFPDSTKPA